MFFFSRKFLRTSSPQNRTEKKRIYATAGIVIARSAFVWPAIIANALYAIHVCRYAQFYRKYIEIIAEYRRMKIETFFFFFFNAYTFLILSEANCTKLLFYLCRNFRHERTVGRSVLMRAAYARRPLANRNIPISYYVY